MEATARRASFNHPATALGGKVLAVIMKAMPGSVTKPQAIALADVALNTPIPTTKKDHFPEAETLLLLGTLMAFIDGQTLGLCPAAVLKRESVHFMEAPGPMEFVLVALRPEALPGAWPETLESPPTVALMRLFRSQQTSPD